MVFLFVGVEQRDRLRHNRSGIGAIAPSLPEDWKVRDLHPDLDSWGTVSAINAGLTELGQIVCETLKEEYIDWEADYEPPEDLPDFD